MRLANATLVLCRRVAVGGAASPLIVVSDISITLHWVLCGCAGRAESVPGRGNGAGLKCGLECRGDGLAGLAGAGGVADDDNLGRGIEREPGGEPGAAADAQPVVEQVAQPGRGEQPLGGAAAGGAGV